MKYILLVLTVLSSFVLVQFIRFCDCKKQFRASAMNVSCTDDGFHSFNNGGGWAYIKVFPFAEIVSKEARMEMVNPIVWQGTGTMRHTNTLFEHDYMDFNYGRAKQVATKQFVEDNGKIFRLNKKIDSLQSIITRRNVYQLKPKLSDSVKIIDTTLAMHTDMQKQRNEIAEILRQNIYLLWPSWRHLTKISSDCADIIFCWGNFKVNGRDKDVIKMFPNAPCFGKNANGSPKHPLYLKSDTKLHSFN